jgi:hypothetical protein
MLRVGERRQQQERLETLMRWTTGIPGVRRWLVGGASLVLAATMAGCSSDDDSGDASATASASAESEPAEFCEAAVDAEAAVTSGPPIDFETATPEEIQAALDKFAAQVEPKLAAVEETAPEEIADAVTTLTGQIRQVLETGDDSLLEQPAYTEADDAIDQYMLAECGFEQIEATGVDYEYEGIPDTVPAGVVAITFTNEGKELHEIGIARVNDDVATPIEELLALPEEELLSMIEFKGAAFAAPDESDTTFMRLEAGRYGGACFIPQGTTHDTEGSGPPHFTLGMFAEFTVE